MLNLLVLPMLAKNVSRIVSTINLVEGNDLGSNSLTDTICRKTALYIDGLISKVHQEENKS